MKCELFSQLKSELTAETLYSVAKTLHDNYQPFLIDIQVWELLKLVIPEEPYNTILEPFKKTILGHEIVNEIVMNTYFGEKKVKYHFAMKHLNHVDEVSIFEMNVGSSRLDFARINGKSHAFEIKTELDSLDKLEKQIFDYSKVFEYVYIITHKRHLKKVKDMIPDFCGIIQYYPENPKFTFSHVKATKKNINIDSIEQVSTMTVKELDYLLKNAGIEVDNKDRGYKEATILSKFNSEKINYWFKETIKKRFQKRWNHICLNIDNIQPIDMQNFYKSTADPKWVYYKNSSMV